MNNTNFVVDPIELTKKLIKIPSYYPFEQKIVDFLKSLLESYNFQVKLIPVDDRFQIYATKGSYNSEKEEVALDNRLLLFGHLDTVPIQGVENMDPTIPEQLQAVVEQAKKLGWDRSPFSAYEEEGKIFGLGAVDMLSEIASFVSVAVRLPEEWFKANQLVIAFTVAEEHLSQGVYEFAKLGMLKGIPAAICGEILDTNLNHPELSAGSDTLVVGRRGRVAYEIEVLGSPAHAAIPHAGINAIEEAARVIRFLQRKIKQNTISLESHSVLPSASMTPLKIKAGTTSLSIPARCTITYDRHFVPPETAEKVQKDLQKVLQVIDPPVNFSIRQAPRPVPYLYSYQTPLDSQIVQIAKDVMKRRTSKLYIKGGNSVADENMLGSPQYPEKIRMNIPIVVLGNRGGNFHQINEWVDITSIYQMEKNVFEICQEWHQYYLKQAHV